MKKIVIALFLIFSTSLFAQSITTASAYFKTISEYYATLKDYEVNFEIKVERQETAGRLSFKAPDLLRLDYTNPEEQVICYNGDTLTIYLPDSDAVLQQSITEDTGAEALTTQQGLSLLSRYY